MFLRMTSFSFTGPLPRNLMPSSEPCMLTFSSIGGVPVTCIPGRLFIIRFLIADCCCCDINLIVPDVLLPHAIFTAFQR